MESRESSTLRQSFYMRRAQLLLTIRHEIVLPTYQRACYGSIRQLIGCTDRADVSKIWQGSENEVKSSLTMVATFCLPLI